MALSYSHARKLLYIIYVPMLIIFCILFNRIGFDACVGTAMIIDKTKGSTDFDALSFLATCCGKFFGLGKSRGVEKMTANVKYFSEMQHPSIIFVAKILIY